jgi:predicted house-cleaning noncanonical NTP pyrophosphatase (MazG superfamily)
MSMKLQQAKQAKRQEMHTLYQQKISEQIENSNQAIKGSLADMAELIEQLKKNLSLNRSKRLTAEEQEELVEQTVEQMLEDEQML